MRANPPRRKFVENPRGTSEAGETENLAIQKRRKKRRGRNCPRKKVSTQCAAQGEYLSVAACRPQSAAQMPHALKRPNRMRRHIFSDNLLRRVNRISRQTKTQEGDAHQCGPANATIRSNTATRANAATNVNTCRGFAQGPFGPPRCPSSPRS